MARETDKPDGTIEIDASGKRSIVLNGRFVYEVCIGPWSFDVDIAAANGWNAKRIMAAIVRLEGLAGLEKALHELGAHG